MRKFGTTEIILSVTSLALLISIFLKAIINLDTSYDTGWYHHVFAARIWGIISKDSFIAEKLVEYRYDGFPLLAHFFQGLLWKITGRLQSTNLVGYLSILAYLCFLRSFFQIPLYLSTIAIFTIPLVLIHSTISYVDLLGNIGASTALMMLYKFFLQQKFPDRRELSAIFVGMLVAANTKPQITVLIGLVWAIAGFRLIHLWFKNHQKSMQKFFQFVFFAFVASGFIFATPIKNVALYRNPLYPIKISVAGIVLNHEVTPKTYSAGNRPQKWVQSIFEINTPDWSHDQYNYSGNAKNLDRAGGFFGAYVVFNLLMLFAFNLVEYARKQKMNSQAAIALLIVAGNSVFVANFPQSHELRYFMFWMVVLVSLNLSILSASDVELSKSQKRRLALAFLAFFAAMCIKIDSYYLRPVFEPVSLPPRGYTSVGEYLKNAVKPELIDQMTPEQRVCLFSRPAIPNPAAVPYASIANAIFYTSYFHPEAKYNYAIQAVTSKTACGGLKIIPSNINKP